MFSKTIKLWGTENPLLKGTWVDWLNLDTSTKAPIWKVLRPKVKETHLLVFKHLPEEQETAGTLSRDWDTGMSHFFFSITVFLTNTGPGRCHFGIFPVTFSCLWLCLAESPTHQHTAAVIDTPYRSKDQPHTQTCHSSWRHVPEETCHRLVMTPTSSTNVPKTCFHHIRKVHTTHIRVTPWAPGSGDLRRLSFLAPQDISYIRQLLQDWEK